MFFLLFYLVISLFFRHYTGLVCPVARGADGAAVCAGSEQACGAWWRGLDGGGGGCTRYVRIDERHVLFIMPGPECRTARPPARQLLDNPGSIPGSACPPLPLPPCLLPCPAALVLLPPTQGVAIKEVFCLWLTWA